MSIRGSKYDRLPGRSQIATSKLTNVKRRQTTNKGQNDESPSKLKRPVLLNGPDQNGLRLLRSPKRDDSIEVKKDM